MTLPIEAQNQIVYLALIACGLIFCIGAIITNGEKRAEQLKFILRISNRHR